MNSPVAVEEEDDELPSMSMPVCFSSRAIVAEPAIPSTVRLFACWNALTAAFVPLPKLPSTVPE